MSKQLIASEIVDSMDSDRIYVIGPGTTTKEIMSLLGIEYTLLGVDATHNGELVGRDLSEQELLDLLDGVDPELIVGVIGGQGFVFARGNQQLSAPVIETIGVDNITIVATEEKIHALEDDPLRVDTGDQEVDNALSGYSRVLTGRGSQMVVQIIQ
ncbi:ATP-NAD kinase family protein [Halogeometricum sp. CBA1124]|uniref:ATP-NAD kinase family protein n=1 Tax=Halogeometricum sp. CBA1124 TaxID=2668071 RepID=UPI00142A7CCF|nr:NAD(+)/NADH kinase [Halogeometricum sp. CBA1124]MUV56818.1 hypothetical protein [Halogeometricum sp. CBA1124]